MKGKKHTKESKEKIKKNNAKHWLGKKFSKEHRKNMSLSHQGPRPWRKGKKVSEEIRNKLSKVHLGKKLPDRSGKNHYNWNPNREEVLNNKKYRTTTEYRKWKMMVISRDKKCCFNNENCNGKLIAHHIKGWKDFPELRFKIGNGMALCEYHHKQIHERHKK